MYVRVYEMKSKLKNKIKSNMRESLMKSKSKRRWNKKKNEWKSAQSESRLMIMIFWMNGVNYIEMCVDTANNSWAASFFLKITWAQLRFL
jgi:hypothetical protein